MSRCRFNRQSRSGDAFGRGVARRNIREDVLHTMELFTLELVSGRSRSGEPAVHQRQQVAVKTTLVRMAHEHLLRILRVHGNLAATTVIADTTEGTIDTNLVPGPMSVERDATLRRRLFERGIRLELIDVDVTGRCQGIGGKAVLMLLFVPDR